jgi:dTDP-4-amino-4,6-dideoxygalactose transaminase
MYRTIPRYYPTYSIFDLSAALHLCLTGNPAVYLADRLRQLFATKHVFLFNGARVALYALLRAYDHPGQVLVPAFNCIAVPEAVRYAGYSPVFVDIGHLAVNMTAGTVKKAISSNTAVVLITHQFGIPCEVDKILDLSKQHGALVVEDAAAAIGAKFQRKLVGSFGDATIISFHLTKVISSGIGGALLTNDGALAHNIHCFLKKEAVTSDGCWRSFITAAAWGAATNSWLYPAIQFGYCTFRGEKMSEVVSPRLEMPPSFLTTCSDFSNALMLRQLDRLNCNLARRRRLAQIYTDQLAGHPYLTLPIIPEECVPSWIHFPIIVDDKQAFYKHMQRNGVDLGWTFRYSCADSFGLNGFPNARRAAETVLGLPTYPSLSGKKAEHICFVSRSYPSGLNVQDGESGKSTT